MEHDIVDRISSLVKEVVFIYFSLTKDKNDQFNAFFQEEKNKTTIYYFF